MTNILIADDNTGLRRLLCIQLRRAGYNPIEAADATAALDQMEHTHIHLFILDVMMPGMDGFTLTEAIRSFDANVPILILSAKAAMEDKKTGFLAGADDYMTKPFDSEELLLRVGALLRRSHTASAGVTTVGTTALNADRLQVQWGETVVELRKMEFDLLLTLLACPLKIFTRQMLMDEVWGYDSESDPRTVDTHVKRVREKLAENPDFSIVTIRGLGYKAVLNKPTQE